MSNKTLVAKLHGRISRLSTKEKPEIAPHVRGKKPTSFQQKCDTFNANTAPGLKYSAETTKDLHGKELQKVSNKKLNATRRLEQEQAQLDVVDILDSLLSTTQKRKFY